MHTLAHAKATTRHLLHLKPLPRLRAPRSLHQQLFVLDAPSCATSCCCAASTRQSRCSMPLQSKSPPTYDTTWHSSLEKPEKCFRFEYVHTQHQITSKWRNMMEEVTVSQSEIIWSSKPRQLPLSDDAHVDAEKARCTFSDKCIVAPPNTVSRSFPAMWGLPVHRTQSARDSVERKRSTKSEVTRACIRDVARLRQCGHTALAATRLHGRRLWRALDSDHVTFHCILPVLLAKRLLQHRPALSSEKMLQTALGMSFKNRSLSSARSAFSSRNPLRTFL